MRLAILDHGHTTLQKVQLAIIKLVAGRLPGPVLMMSYRRELFGKHLGLAFQDAMRGPSEWSFGEREIFAAFVSRLNQCLY